ncbi:MAG: valine--tRNA ligase [Candidatus Ranarchaeia archaeon]
MGQNKDEKRKFRSILKDKQWNPEFEEGILDEWQKKEVYRFRLDKDKPIFSIDTPPPYASGNWHVGGATHYAQIDMIARTKRMQGFNVIFPMAVDRNGLPIEVQVEKEYNISMYDVPREKFLRLCREFLDRHEDNIIQICMRLGLSCNSFKSSDITRTDSDDYRARTQSTFIELWKKGEVSEANRPNNWCPECHTTIADAEVEYKEKETALNHLAFKIKETGETLEIATTRPELLAACRCVLVHPDDERYTKITGLHAIVPLYEHEVPIIANREAKREFGTGAMMVCSYGDYTDVKLFRELKLQPVAAIDPEGRMTKAAGPYEGLKVAEARAKIIQDLEAKGLLIKKDKIVQRYPTCWRSRNPIEFIAMPEFYLRQQDYVPDLLKVADQIEFHPPRNKQLLIDWLHAISADWPISRRRYYGTEIPVWYCNSCKKPVLPEPGPYYQPWKDDPPFKKCPICGDEKGFTGETRTFDTWMDSSISALVAIGYLRDDTLFKKAFPCSLRPQGKDIVRTWLNYTLLRVYQLFKKPAFRHVWISGMVLDANGRAMHKSAGNVILPWPLLETYGADAFRLMGALEASIGSDLRFNTEKIKGAFKFLTKLWNIARYVSSFPMILSDGKGSGDYTLLAADRWILSVMDHVIEESLKGYEALDFNVPARLVRSFIWETFASHYLEMVKPRAYNADQKYSSKEQRGAWFTLHTVLFKMLKLLAVICPFITEKISQSIYLPNTSIHLQEFPSRFFSEPGPYLDVTPLITELNKAIWKTKTDNGLSLRDPISETWLPEELTVFCDDLKAMHNIREINEGVPPSKGKYEVLKIQDKDVYLKVK